MRSPVAGFCPDQEETSCCLMAEGMSAVSGLPPEELQLQGFLLVEVVDIVVGHLQIHLLRGGVVGEKVADRSGSSLHSGADAVIVVVPHKGGEGGHSQQQHKEDHADAVDHPAPANAFIDSFFHRQLIPS